MRTTRTRLGSPNRSPSMNSASPRHPGPSSCPDAASPPAGPAFERPLPAPDLGRSPPPGPGPNPPTGTGCGKRPGVRRGRPHQPRGCVSRPPRSTERLQHESQPATNRPRPPLTNPAHNPTVRKEASNRAATTPPPPPQPPGPPSPARSPSPSPGRDWVLRGCPKGSPRQDPRSGAHSYQAVSPRPRYRFSQGRSRPSFADAGYPM